MNTFKYKAVLLGESGVGKSTFLKFIIDNVYQDNLHSTIGANFENRKIKVDKVNAVTMFWVRSVILAAFYRFIIYFSNISFLFM